MLLPRLFRFRPLPSSPSPLHRLLGLPFSTSTSRAAAASSSSPSFYALLQVPRTASLEEIKAAFRTQAKLHHPDAQKGRSSDSGEPSSEEDETFKALSAAYTVLSDPGESRGSSSTASAQPLHSLRRH